MSELDVSRIPAGPDRVNRVPSSGGKMDRAARRDLLRRRKRKKGEPDGEPDQEDASGGEEESQEDDLSEETRGRYVDQRA
jgi:hypothetical protein